MGYVSKDIFFSIQKSANEVDWKLLGIKFLKHQYKSKQVTISSLRDCFLLQRKIKS